MHKKNYIKFMQWYLLETNQVEPTSAYELANKWVTKFISTHGA